MSRKYKVSSISQADDAINDLNDDINRALANVNNRLNNISVEADRIAQRRAREEAQRAKNEMQSRLNSAISSVNAHIDRVDAEQRQRLNRMAGEIYDDIIKVNDSLHNAISQTGAYLDGRITSVQQQTNKRLQQLNSHLNQLETQVAKRFDEQQSQLDSHARQIDTINTKIDSILAQMADERQKREEAAKLALEIRKATYGRIDMERFAPAQSQEIDRRLALLKEPYDEGTVAASKDLIIRIQMAEEEAVRNKIIYDTIHAEAVSMVEKALEEVNKNREISIAHPDSPDDVATIETDFWNHGEYEKLRSRLEALRNELAQQPSVERMKEIMEEIAKGEVMLASMLGTATERAILSENRVVITEDIISALCEQGWQLETTAEGKDAVGYLGGEEQDNDWREGVYAILQSMNGERISIVVAPDENEQTNDIIFHRNDNSNITERDYMRSLERIKQQIAKSGYKLGPTEVPADGGNTEIPEMTDAAKLGRRGAAKKISQRTMRRK